MISDKLNSNSKNTSTNRLEARDIDVTFGATTALAKANFSVKSGEIHALLGENGAGKSTLMKVLAGSLIPDRGEMFLDGAPYQPHTPLDGRLAGVAMIYQELSMAPHLTVAENICLGLEPVRSLLLDRHEMEERSRSALDKLGHGDMDLHRPADELSISEQQLVEIARSIALGCKVLILDEPTSSLTRSHVDKLFALLNRLKSQGYAIIYISHFIEEVREVADRFTVLRDGCVAVSGDPKTVSTDEIVSLMLGSKTAAAYPRSDRNIGNTILTVSNLASASKVESASFTLRRGEVLGIAGLVGSGRTELVRAIFGLEAVLKGEIKIGSYSGQATPHTRWNQSIGYLSENRKDEGVAVSMDIASNLILPSAKSLTNHGLLLPAAVDTAMKTWIEKLNVKCSGPRAKMLSLSGGNQQKVALARLLFRDVDVLILDEPTRGIDVKTKNQIYALIDNLAKEGKAILMISSYLPELLGVCDRIAVMNRGKLGESRPTSNLTEQQLMVETVSAN
jgi:ribose transport system ATP-binding protein